MDQCAGARACAIHAQEQIELCAGRRNLGDVREVMIEGPSGILAHARGDRPRYEATRRRLVWSTGAVAQAFSSENPESCAGRNSKPPGATSWRNGRMPKPASTCCNSGLRLGDRPRQLITTTPRPTAADQAADGRRGGAGVAMATVDNAANLAASFLERCATAMAARGLAGRNSTAR